MPGPVSEWPEQTPKVQTIIHPRGRGKIPVVASRAKKGIQVRKDFTVERGETLDLGNILIENPAASEPFGGSRFEIRSTQLFDERDIENILGELGITRPAAPQYHSWDEWSSGADRTGLHGSRTSE